MNTEENAIVAVLKTYEGALNAGSSQDVLSVFAEDGVFMAENAPSSVGAAAVGKAYDAVFGAIRFEVKFAIEEVHQLAPEWGFARTNSTGTVRVNATGESAPEANQELFLFQKVAGSWKIARYSFSTILPPRG